MSKLIAICGGSGSGKTVLATALAKSLGSHQVCLVSEDAYYRDFSSLGSLVDGLNFDKAEAKDLDQLRLDLTALKFGSSVKKQHYCMKTRIRSTLDETIEPKEFVVVEGIHVLNHALRDLFDLTVFIDTPHHIRLARRIIRDVGTRGRKMSKVVDTYMRNVLPAYDSEIKGYEAFADICLKDLCSDIVSPAKCMETDFISASVARIIDQLDDSSSSLTAVSA